MGEPAAVTSIHCAAVLSADAGHVIFPTDPVTVKTEFAQTGGAVGDPVGAVVAVGAVVVASAVAVGANVGAALGTAVAAVGAKVGTEVVLTW
jgi:hypothetical protein|tara:strand:- start:948 stop:1223 length:276 start_codon:yes stop_codon:yes gene_type:complete